MTGLSAVSGIGMLAGRFRAPAYHRGDLKTLVRPLGRGRYGVEAAASGTLVISRAGAEVIG